MPTYRRGREDSELPGALNDSHSLSINKDSEEIIIDFRKGRLGDHKPVFSGGSMVERINTDVNILYNLHVDLIMKKARRSVHLLSHLML